MALCVQAMYECVKAGDIDLLDDLLDLPAADINMTWVGLHQTTTTLLMLMYFFDLARGSVGTVLLSECLVIYIYP